jgi:general secretion pathway protein K
MRRNEDGVALLTVLLLVAIISGIAVSLLDDMRFALRRAGNAETISQAQWYAIGAEALARTRLAELAGNPAAARTWNGRWVDFPIDDGLMRVRFDDATQCFNLNSVVEGVPEQWQRRDLGLRQFAALLGLIGVPRQEASRLSERLSDWIDSDQTRNTMGGEDDLYSNGAHSYRTSGALLAEVSELRAISGFTPEVYARIRPYVCALPTADLSPVNINNLDEERALLLAALLEASITPAQARSAIAARPAAGWRTVEQFWTQGILAENLPGDAVLSQVTLRPRFVTLEADVTYASSEVVMTALFERPESGQAKLFARRWTIDE